MESTIDNSDDKIISAEDSLLIEEKLMLEDFNSHAVINGKNEIVHFLRENRNGLIKLLGSIKQNFHYFSMIREALENIIRKIEDLILMIYSADASDMSQCLSCLNKLFELFIILFQYDTNNSFLELFFSIFTNFLKRLSSGISESTRNTIAKHYSHYYTRIYNILVEKKIEYIDKLRDSKISVGIVKIVYLLLDKIHPDHFSEEIKFIDLFNFLLTTKNNLFALSNDIFLDKMSEMIVKIFKKVVKLTMSNHIYREDILKIAEILLVKMLEIGKVKDDLKDSIDYSQQIFYVNTLILSLKLVKIIIKYDAWGEEDGKSGGNAHGSSLPVSILKHDNIKSKLTRVLMELSFWDNYSIVDYTCKLFHLIWNKCLFYDVGMRSNFEKIIEYMYLRRYQTYYNYLTQGQVDTTVQGQGQNISPSVNIDDFASSIDPTSANIKLSVLEIITKYLNKLIEDSKFLIICYISFDYSKIRFNLVGEIFNSLQKYYGLNGSGTNYLKKLISITYLVTSKEILRHLTSNEASDMEINQDFIKIQNNLSESWLQVLKAMNAGSFKKFYEKMRGIFGLKMLDKKAEIEKEADDVKILYKKVAKAVALLVKYSYYVDITILYETMADNHEFSNLIMDEYCKTFNFSGLDLLKAYELYVSTFKLCGEPHNIYNFLMHFAKQYFLDNKDLDTCPFKTEDMVSTLAYSILMLNTDLHNPNLPKHMTCEEFVTNNLKTKLFDNFPLDYMRNIYKSIASDPLLIAKSRIADYVKCEEIFMVIDDKSKYTGGEDGKVMCKNIISVIEEYNPSAYKGKDIFNPFTLLTYPFLNVCENFKLEISNGNFINSNIRSVYSLLWEDIFYNLMSMPRKFYEMKDENTLRILENVCKISQNLEQEANVDKLIMTLHSIINSYSTPQGTNNTNMSNLSHDKRNIVNLYNLFFNISINYSKNFNSYLEVYYDAILDIIKHKIDINSINKISASVSINDLKYDYNSLINSILEKTFSIINAKRHKKTNSGGLFDYFFSRGSKPESEFEIEQYKADVLNKYLKLNSKIGSSQQHQTPTLNTPASIPSLSEPHQDNLIEISKVIEIIKNQEEEFIFFVTLSASKILDYANKSEFYLSLIFLNEILDSKLSAKEFIKIWQNLYNIFKSKMEFKHIFEKEENLFDIFYANHFLCEIMTRFCNVIEVEDYYQLLENYLDIENMDVLYYIMENNDRMVVSLKTFSHRKIIDKIFEICVNLIYKLIEHFSQQIVAGKNNYSLHKLSNTVVFFKDLISCVNDLSILSPDSMGNIFKIMNILHENNFVYVFWSLLENNWLIFEVVDSIIDKMETCLPKTDDEMWDLFVFLMQFCLKSALVESEDIQRRYVDAIIKMFNLLETLNRKIPLMKFKEINSVLSNYYTGFTNLKLKYEGYWADIFKIFFFILSNNEELLNSQNEIEALWNLFVKKYLISFVDYNKKVGNVGPTSKDAQNYKQELNKIFTFTISKVKGMNEKPSWWESGKNIARLYFPDIVKDA